MNNMNFNEQTGQPHPNYMMQQQPGQQPRMMMPQQNRMIPNQPGMQHPMHMQQMRPQQQFMGHNQQGQPMQGQPGQNMHGMRPMNASHSVQKQQYISNLINSMPPEYRARFENATTADERSAVVNEFRSRFPQQPNMVRMPGQQAQMHRQGQFPIKQQQGGPPGHYMQQQQPGPHHEQQFQQIRSQQQFMSNQPPQQQQQHPVDVKPPLQPQQSSMMQGQMQQPSPQIHRPGSVKPVQIAQQMNNNNMSGQMSSNSSMVNQIQPSPQTQYKPPSVQPNQQGPPSAQNQQPPTPQQVQQQMAQHKHSPMMPSSQPTQRPGGPGSVGGPRSMHNTFVPSPATAPSSQPPQQHQPPSVQQQSIVNVQQPTPQQRSSTPIQSQQMPTARPPTVAAAAAPVVDQEDPEYKAIFNELKELRPKIILFMEKVKMENYTNTERSMTKVLEQIDGKITMDIRMMQKSLKHIKDFEHQIRPVRALNEFIKKVSVIPMKTDSPILPDKWEGIEKYRIQVPQSLMDSVAKELEQQRMSRKRKAPELREVAMEEQANAVYDLRCANPKMNRIKVPREIFEHLSLFNYQVDPDTLPTSEYSTYVQILIEFSNKKIARFNYFVPPLRVLIPLKYPKEPIQLGETCPFRSDAVSPLALRIMDQLKKEVTDQTFFSLPDLVQKWREVATTTVVPVSDMDTRRMIAQTFIKS